jgi:hypothetical protein
MKPLHRHTVGLVVGSFLGTVHLVWSILVALGWAEPLMTFIFRLHFIEPPYHQIAPFHIGSAILLIVIASLVGYGAGSLFAALWNRIHRSS